MIETTESQIEEETPDYEQVIATLPEKERVNLVDDLRAGEFRHAELLDRAVAKAREGKAAHFERAFTALFQSLFRIKENKDSAEQLLRDELTERGMLSGEDAATLSVAELDKCLNDFYLAKEELIQGAQLEIELGSDDLSTEYGPLEVSQHYSGSYETAIRATGNDRIFMIESVRRQIDSSLPDEIFHRYKIWRAQKDEEILASEQSKEIARRELSFWQFPPRLEAQKRYRETHQLRLNKMEEADAQRFLEFNRKTEEESIARVEGILESGSANEDDTTYLNRWLDLHHEFGLEQMDDAEYLAYFVNGEFYMHSSSLFHENEQGGLDPRFTEALKDGYLVGTQIGSKRNEQIIGLTNSESNVSFDSQRVLLPRDNKQLTEWHHLGFAVLKPSLEVPITLIAPAQLLNKHSINLPINWETGEHMWMAEGEHFGSGNPDASSRTHEIPLSLFIMIAPNINLSKQQLEIWLQNFEEDSRFSKVTKLSEWGGIKSGLMQDVGPDGVNLPQFLTIFLGLLKQSGASVPRLFLQAAPVPENFENGGACNDYLEKTVREFLGGNNIPISENVARTSISSYLPDQVLHEVRPFLIDGTLAEKYRVPSYVLNDVANRVRIQLKKLAEQTQTSAANQSPSS